MKTFLALLAAAALIPAAFADSATVTVRSNSAPDQYADIADGLAPSGVGLAANLEAIKDLVVAVATPAVPAGHTLEVELDQIDLAGEFEPFDMGSNVRMIRDGYPPRIDLTFRLLGPDGHIVKEGKRQLRNPNFMLTLSTLRQDRFRYENELLVRWVNAEFKSAQ